MNKKINVSTIIIIILSVAVIGLLIWGGNKNKTDTVAVDEHGHSLPINATIASLTDLIGKKSPDFSLADRDGKLYSLSELRGKNIVLFFNEGLMCYPACWNQIVAFAKDERFKNADTVVLSVVVDPPGEWQRAIDKMPELAEATVVFDINTEVSKKLDMLKTASSMHYGSLPGHTFVLIDKEGVIRHIFDDPNMSIHNDELIKEIAKLEG